MNEEDEAKVISGLTARLVARFPLLSAREVEDVVSSVYRSFDGARVRGFVPLLVEHDALIRLKERSSQTDERTSS